MNVNDLRILLGHDGIYRTKIIIHVVNNTITITYTIPKTENIITEIFSLHQQEYIIKKFNFRACIFTNALTKSIHLNQPIFVYSLDVKV